MVNVSPALMHRVDKLLAANNVSCAAIWTSYGETGVRCTLIKRDKGVTRQVATAVLSDLKGSVRDQANGLVGSLLAHRYME